MSDMLKSVGVKDVGLAATEVYVAPVGKTSVVIGANVCNNLDETIYVDIQLKKGSVIYNLIKGVYIPANCAYIWSGMEQKVVLDPGDSFIIKSTKAASCDVVVSVTEIV